MCITNNAIELQAYQMKQKIQECTVYSLVKVIYKNEKNIEVQNSPSNKQNQISLISKIILQDKEGNLFQVEPNENGLRFAEGAITYKEYKRLQNKEDKLMLALFVFLTGLTFIVGFAFIKFLGISTGD